MGCNTSKDAISRLETAPARKRGRANLKLDISTHSSTSSPSQNSTCLSEDSPLKKLQLPCDDCDYSNNNEISTPPHSDADTVALTPFQLAATDDVVERTSSRTSSSWCPIGDDAAIDNKHSLLSRSGSSSSWCPTGDTTINDKRDPLSYSSGSGSTVYTTGDIDEKFDLLSCTSSSSSGWCPDYEAAIDYRRDFLSRSGSSSSWCTADEKDINSKRDILSRAMDQAISIDSTEDTSTESEDDSGEESVAKSEPVLHDKGEHLEAATTNDGTTAQTGQKHALRGPLDLNGKASAQEQVQEPSAQPESAPQQIVIPRDPSVPAELQLFLEQHRSPLPNLMEDRTGAEPPPSRVDLQVGLIYEGQLRRRDGLPHGWGRVTLPDGAAYEGEWLGGRVHGKGALHLPNGNAYWGSWALGRKHGLGTFLWADGSRHDGYYRAGIKSGAGTLRYRTGSVYEGEFEADRRHGVGRLELPDGSSYDGEWKRDIPDGLGVFVDAGYGGERFEGSWERGVRSGGGRVVQGWAEKEEKGKTFGNVASASTRSWEETAWYSGNFKNGLPHGEGAMGFGLATFCGHVERGEWTGGGGILDLGGGRGSFEGTFTDGLPSGSGRWCWEESGVEIDCSFEEGYSKNIWPS